MAADAPRPDTTRLLVFTGALALVVLLVATVALNRAAAPAPARSDASEAP